MNGAKRRFCAQPFRSLEIAESGDAYLCCQGWLPTSIGNVWQDSVSAIWNSGRAQAIRSSILDNSFRYCTACPFLPAVSGCVHYADEVEDPDERSILTARNVTSDGPSRVNLAYDRTCNLSCPSCRTGLVVATGGQFDGLKLLQNRVLAGDFLERIEWLNVTGSGDPFASRLYRDLLRSIDPDRYPRLRVRLHTNGLLFTADSWSDLGPVRARVHEVEISIDAAGAATYALNRRGGDWQTLLTNLDFIASLRRNGPIGTLQFSFVVQSNNWREMPAFVEMASRYGVDRIFFSALRNWNTFDQQEYAQRAVHLAAHPDHAMFVKSLTDARLQRPEVTLGELSA